MAKLPIYTRILPTGPEALKNLMGGGGGGSSRPTWRVSPEVRGNFSARPSMEPTAPGAKPATEPVPYQPIPGALPKLSPKFLGRNVILGFGKFELPDVTTPSNQAHLKSNLDVGADPLVGLAMKQPDKRQQSSKDKCKKGWELPEIDLWGWLLALIGVVSFLFRLILGRRSHDCHAD